MPRITYYLVIPFIRTPDGTFLALDPEEATDVAKAKHRAFNIVGQERGDDQVVGTIAFSRSGDPTLGDFEDALILARYGETPENLEGLA
ncbi:hypothetical protein LMIY3S_01128 [Labrys miyagiensis]